ncbi:MAG: Wzz/FepE/Etk N-terminal domain-containing protein [Gammaproteobacteria bacterium]|nr:Wzz/FepE/Etk N-terminal domain-containing protein [Gammaproteobacteria bacterium]
MLDDRDYLADEGKGLGDFLSSLRRRKKLGLITAAVVFVVGVFLTLVWPTKYTSTAVILIEEPEVPEQLVQTTVTTFAAQQIQLINQRVMTRSNLAAIIEQFDLFAEQREYLPTLLLVKDVQDQIQMDLINVELQDPRRGLPTLETIAFTVGFEHEDPRTAQQVANQLVSLYMEENVRSRTVQTAETSEFLGTEVARLDREVKQLEDELAAFKEANKDSLPEIVQLNMQIMQRTEDQVLDVRRQLQSIEESRILLRAQLAQVDKMAPTILPDGQAVVSPENQIKALETRLAMFKGQYSEDHPDVVRTRRELEALRAQTGITGELAGSAAALTSARAELAKASETYTDDHPEVQRLQRLVTSLESETIAERERADALVKPDNPAYIQIDAQLSQLDADETALRMQERELRQRLDEFEQSFRRAPRVEQELFALQRQLSTATQQYVAMREREFGAEMGQALESQSKGERFVLVEPPDLPLQPSSPNRPVLLLMLLILAPAIGIGLIQLRASMDNALWSPKDVESVQGFAPIAEIPVILNEDDVAHRKRLMLLGFAGVPAVLALAAILVHFAIRPLDVLWFTVARQLGM